MRPLVALIGAGPGDPELITLKAVRALGAADVVLVDELVNRGCLAHVRSTAKIIEVGKRGGCKSTPQAFIEKLLVLYAKQGRNVARLKGGDPFVFGRGVTFVTGHTKDGTQPDWQALARSRTTIVIYMGLKGLPGILSTLISAGMDPATPACIIENGTLHDQKQRVATLGTLRGDGFSGPALIVIGDVVRFARAEGEMRDAGWKAKAA